MTTTTTDPLTNPTTRRAFEEELLYGEATDTVSALLESLGLTRSELAERLGVSKGRVSQILSGSENITLKTLASLGWALGIRFDLHPTPMESRVGTPSENDPPAPLWLKRLAPEWTPRVVRLPARPVPAPTLGSSLHAPPTGRALYPWEVAA